MNVLNFSN